MNRMLSARVALLEHLGILICLLVGHIARSSRTFGDWVSSYEEVD